MKERSKERMAALLMDELLTQLGERENIRRMLGEMTGLPVDELLEQLLDEFEQTVKRYHQRSVESRELEEKAIWQNREEERPLTSRTDQLLPEPDVRETRAEETHPEPPYRAQEPDFQAIAEEVTRKPLLDSDTTPVSGRDSLLDTRLQVPGTQAPTAAPPPQEPAKPPAPPVPPAVRPDEEKERSLRERLEELERKLQAELEKAASQRREIQRPVAGPVGRATPADQGPADSRLPLDGKFDAKGEADRGGGTGDTGEVAAQKRELPAAPLVIADDDVIYLHAVGAIPEGTPASTEPFMLEEKGIDGKEFAFALDRNGLRFYLSKLPSTETKTSKKGMLLLGKQESLQLRGAHEAILNDMRGHGILLPFEFGSVALGKETLFDKIDTNIGTIRKAFEDMLSTERWTLNLFVLDARIAELVGTDASPARRERDRDRTSHGSVASKKKYDIKLLERILNKEKKMAESVHAELEKIADQCAVEMIVGMGSGSSEDWKLIFKAWYEIPSRRMASFNRAVTDLQYHHILFDPMLSLTGNQEYYTFNT